MTFLIDEPPIDIKLNRIATEYENMIYRQATTNKSYFVAIACKLYDWKRNTKTNFIPENALWNVFFSFRYRTAKKCASPAPKLYSSRYFVGSRIFKWIVLEVKVMSAYWSNFSWSIFSSFFISGTRQSTQLYPFFFSTELLIIAWSSSRMNDDDSYKVVKENRSSWVDKLQRTSVLLHVEFRFRMSLAVFLVSFLHDNLVILEYEPKWHSRNTTKRSTFLKSSIAVAKTTDLFWSEFHICMIGDWMMIGFKEINSIKFVSFRKKERKKERP